MNLKIKYRESFRPVRAGGAGRAGGGVLRHRRRVAVHDARRARRRAASARATASAAPTTCATWVNEVRSEIPAVTHVDHSARLQTVNRDQSPEFHAILSAFDELTGCPVMINTSFNVRGEPIVCTPEDAYRCFMRTEMDHLVLGGHLLDKPDQPRVDRGRALAGGLRPRLTRCRWAGRAVKHWRDGQARRGRLRSSPCCSWRGSPCWCATTRCEPGAQSVHEYPRWARPSGRARWIGCATPSSSTPARVAHDLAPTTCCCGTSPRR